MWAPTPPYKLRPEDEARLRCAAREGDGSASMASADFDARPRKAPMRWPSGDDERQRHAHRIWARRECFAGLREGRQRRAPDAAASSLMIILATQLR